MTEIWLPVPPYEHRDAPLTENGFLVNGEIVKSIKVTKEQVELYNKNLLDRLGQNVYTNEVVAPVVTEIVEEEVKTENVEEIKEEVQITNETPKTTTKRRRK